MRPKVNLSNDITVRALKWHLGDPEQFRVRDHDRMGFYLRITRQGKRTWEYRYPVDNGQYRYLVLGHFPKMKCAEALVEYEKYREQVKGYGTDPKKSFTGSAQSLDNLFDKHYLPKYAEVKKKTWEEDRDLFDLHVRSLIGAKNADAVDQNDIELVIGTLEQANKLHTARKTFAVLNKMFNWGISRTSALQPGSGPLLTSLNPCKGVVVAKPPPSSKRSLTQAEIVSIWNHLNDKSCIDRVIKMLLLTGCRVAEITELHSDEIDWDAVHITLQPDRTRNRRLHIIPLTDRMKGIIGSKKTGYIFPAKSEQGCTTTSGVRIALNRYCTELKIDHISPHDFRDTFISHMARIGVILEIRNRVTNHADSSVDGVNYNAYDYYQEKLNALRKWDRELAKIIKASKRKASD